MNKEEYMQMYEIAGAAMEVHKVLGHGLEETIYQEALQRELALRGIKCELEAVIECFYKGQKMDKFYKADIICNGIIVELKAVEKLISDHRAQLFNYMRLTHSERGMLINFGEKSLRTERYILDMSTNETILLTKNNLKEHVK